MMNKFTQSQIRKFLTRIIPELQKSESRWADPTFFSRNLSSQAFLNDERSDKSVKNWQYFLKPKNSQIETKRLKTERKCKEKYLKKKSQESQNCWNMISKN